MGLLEKIGIRKNKHAPKAAEEKREKRTETAPEIAGKHKLPKARLAAKSKKAGDRGSAYLNLIRPIVSEKATMLASENKYVFAVSPRVNKSEIKKNIERVYGVSVERVNVINLSGKFRRQGKSFGRTSDWKKAVIKVKKGDKIAGIIESA